MLRYDVEAQPELLRADLSGGGANNLNSTAEGYGDDDLDDLADADNDRRSNDPEIVAQRAARKAARQQAAVREAQVVTAAAAALEDVRHAQQFLILDGDAELVTALSAFNADELLGKVKA